MRKGKLLIVENLTIKEKGIYFDTEKKMVVEVIKITDNAVKIQEIMNRHASYSIDILTVNEGRLVKLIIEDDVTYDKFEIIHFQQYYIYSAPSRDRLFFITHKIAHQEFAYAVCKESGTQSQINKFAPIADAYGKYVCQQKAINEPAKKFDDWYFAVSI